MQQTPLGSQALVELNHIEKESGRAEKLLSLIIQRRPVSQDERDYENTVSVMVDFREKLLSINEESEREVKKDAIAEVVKLLCEENNLLAEVVEYGRDTLDKLLEAKQQRHKCIPTYIQDMHERIYWLVGDLIAEIENFDEFERSINKLVCLKYYLCRRLRQELKKYI